MPCEFAAMKLPAILFICTNGAGLGHMSRCLSYARQLREQAEPVFFRWLRRSKLSGKWVSQQIILFRPTGLVQVLQTGIMNCVFALA